MSRATSPSFLWMILMTLFLFLSPVSEIQATAILLSETRSISAQTSAEASPGIGYFSEQWSDQAAPVAPFAPFDRTLSHLSQAVIPNGGSSEASALVSQMSVIQSDLIEGQLSFRIGAFEDRSSPLEVLRASAGADLIFQVRFQLTEPHFYDLSVDSSIGAPRASRAQVVYSLLGEVVALDGYENAGDRQFHSLGILEPRTYFLSFTQKGRTTEFDGREETHASARFRLALQPVPDPASTFLLLGCGLLALGSLQVTRRFSTAG